MIGKSDKLFHYDKNCLVYQLHYVIKTTYNPNNNKKKKNNDKKYITKIPIACNGFKCTTIFGDLEYINHADILYLFICNNFIMFFIFVFSFAFFFQFDFFYKIKKMVQY